MVMTEHHGNELPEDAAGTARPNVLIIDSFALLFRGFYSMAMVGNYMRTSEGLCTNGLYQFSRYLLDAVKVFRPSHVVCAFDMGAHTFRNELYPEYKANREQPPEELVPQFDKLWELVDAFDIPAVGQPGYEADDIIGSLARKFSDQQAEVNILTGDGDALQLLNERTKVTFMKKGFGNYQTVTLSDLPELKEIERPEQIIDLKALMGDASDNIPGCPGVGPKTAVKLLREFDHIDRLFENIDQVKGKLQQRLLEHKEMIYMSKKLAAIRTDLDLGVSLEQCELGWDREKLLNKLEQFEWKTLIRQLSETA